ncbi:MAG: hypothetical protein M3P44_11650, partial [Actinomycetota bacterium]|nr:hypothetical protein [Actinomycetota bacterium]
RPHRVRVRAGRALTFPRAEHASPRLAAAVTDRIWRCVELQWEWLGGTPRIRRAAVIGAGERGEGIAAHGARVLHARAVAGRSAPPGSAGPGFLIRLCHLLGTTAAERRVAA